MKEEGDEKQSLKVRKKKKRGGEQECHVPYKTSLNPEGVGGKKSSFLQPTFEWTAKEHYVLSVKPGAPWNKKIKRSNIECRDF